MKCATPRNRSKSKGIDEAFSVTGALFRCIVTLEGTKSREREVSRLPRSGRKHSYTSSDRIRNDTEVEEVETEMAPTFQPRTQQRSNIGRRLRVWAIQRAAVIYLRAVAIGCDDRLPPLGQAPQPSGARKPASARGWRNDFLIKTIDRVNRCDGYRSMLLKNKWKKCWNFSLHFLSL